MLVVIALALAVTGFVSLAPGVHFAYESPAGHASIETAASFIGVLAAFLLYARYRLRHMVADLCLAAALAILAITNLSLAVVPALAAQTAGVELVWARVFSETSGLVLFALAAWAPSRHVRRPRRAAPLAAVVVAGVPIVSVAAAFALAGVLPRPIDGALSAYASLRPAISGSVLLEVAQVADFLAFAAAGFGFARRARQTGDDLFAWLGLAAVLGAFSRIHYFLYPSLFSPWVHTGDFLRLGYFMLVLVAALREIAGYQPKLARAAVLDERRRIARELHDGLAQEVAFIAGGLRSLDGGRPAEDEIAILVDAADQAMLESRQAISALSAPSDEPFGTALSRVAEMLALRTGTPVRVDVDSALRPRPVVRDAALRIAREALTNALKHADGEVVALTAYGDSELHLSVRDDGVGFAPVDGHLRDGAVGLSSMRERAEAVGGHLLVRSGPGQGTVVEAVLPI